jgi:hypothetical protein
MRCGCSELLCTWASSWADPSASLSHLLFALHASLPPCTTPSGKDTAPVTCCLTPPQIHCSKAIKIQFFTATWHGRAPDRMHSSNQKQKLGITESPEHSTKWTRCCGLRCPMRCRESDTYNLQFSGPTQSPTLQALPVGASRLQCTLSTTSLAHAYIPLHQHESARCDHLPLPLYFIKGC